MEEISSSPALEVSPSAVLYFGPEKINSVFKQIALEKRDLINPEFKYFNDVFFLKVAPGNSKKIRTIEIRIDGNLILNTDDFKDKGEVVIMQLNDLTSSSQIEIRMEGNRGSFITFLIEGTIRENVITDVDGNYYNTVVIGNQVWMAENLKTKHFNNGDSIFTTIPPDMDLTGPTWQEYHRPYQWPCNGDENLVADYGRLYFWYGTVDERGLCPTGWHVATINEWTVLSDYLGGAEIAGGKLKEEGTEHWNSPNVAATNEVGFNAVPAGWRIHYGSFSGLGTRAIWWTSSRYNEGGPGSNIWGSFTEIYNTSAAISLGQPIYMYAAHAVRCIKDQ
jgi:uncharacterized protein (TIGR02145 family)